jgi:hypothetical protein
LVFFFAIAEVDRVRSVSHDREAQLLANSFTSIRDSACTQASDAERIRAEIGENVCAVDQTIDTLIRAGMSTQSLRMAYEHGVDVQSAAHVEYALVFMAWAWCMSVGIFMLGDVSSGMPSIMFLTGLINIVLGTLWVVFLMHSGKDVQTFSIAIKAKTTSLFLIPVNFLLALIVDNNEMKDAQACDIVFALCTAISWLLIVPLSLARIHRVACLPLCGPQLAQFLLARSRKRLFSACRCCGRCPHRKDSSSSDSDKSSSSSNL